MASSVSNGVYFGFSADEVAEERRKYVAAVKQMTSMAQAAGGGRVAGGTFNGQTVTFSYPPGVNTLEAWRLEIERAENELNDADQTVVDRFQHNFTNS
jgi:hypothetical protein